MRLLLLACQLAFLLPAAAATPRTVRLSVGSRAEDSLRRFIEHDPSLKARLAEASARQDALLAQVRDSDLRDAVADSDIPRDDRLQIEQLPGMKALAPHACRTLSDCAVPELALDVADDELLADSVRRLVRPWMLLQQARGASLELSAAQFGDEALNLTLEGLGTTSFTLNVSPRLLGGFKVWFDQPLVLASLYGRERDAVLKR